MAIIIIVVDAIFTLLVQQGSYKGKLGQVVVCFV